MACGCWREGLTMTPDDLRTLTVEEAAAILRVYPETVRRWIRNGSLEAMAWGRRLRIAPRAIAEFQRHHVVRRKRREKRVTEGRREKGLS